MHKTIEDALSGRRMGNLRMKLDTVVASLFIGHCCHRSAFCRSNNLETLRNLRDLVAMAHPDVVQDLAVFLDGTFQVAQQQTVFFQSNGCMAEFRFVRCLDHPAQLLRHGMHPVANTQYRHPGLK